ncbi:MAG TPA: hypothetical protein VHG28_12265 [Longimicrobiaceae bacterium]|nr:hypothetical protein [Longimicrobiaceae bacterium]
MRALRTAAAVLFVALSAACAPAATSSSFASGPADEPAPAPARREHATVRVTNNNWSNMTVYVVRGTSRFRLGMVTSMTTAVFRLPMVHLAGASGVRLLADPIGSTQTYLTPVLYVSGGERVDFEIQNHLPISSVSVWGQ